MLKYSKANAKTEAMKKVEELKPFLANRRHIYSLDLLSGYSCPFAKDCLAKVKVNEDGKRKVHDGADMEFRCFSASQEAQYTNTYNSRKHNFDSLKHLTCDEMFEKLQEAMPKNLGICRIHVAGDFFNADYLLAWAKMAEANPDRLFYAYTKSIRFWELHKDVIDGLDNFVLTASQGGREDHKIDENELRKTKVVFSEAEAAELGLEIDHDDSHAARPSLKNQDFALLIHGTQPKGSEASVALKALKGKGSYSRKKETFAV